MKTIYNQVDASTTETLADGVADAVLNLIFKQYLDQPQLQAEALTHFITAITGAFAGLAGDSNLIALLQQLITMATEAAEHDQASATH